MIDNISVHFLFFIPIMLGLCYLFLSLCYVNRQQLSTWWYPWSNRCQMLCRNVQALLAADFLTDAIMLITGYVINGGLMCWLVHCSAYLGVCSTFYESSFLENHINCIQLGAVAKRWQLTVLPAVFLGQFRREIKVRVYAFLASNTLSHIHTPTHIGHAHNQVGWQEV